MRWRAILPAGLGLAAVLAAVPAVLRGCSPGPARADTLAAVFIRAALEGPEAARPDTGIRLVSRGQVQDFYRKRAYVPAWLSHARGKDRAAELLARLGRAGEEGLRPDHYHLDSLRALLADSQEPRDLWERDSLAAARAEAMLSDAWFTYATHLLSGRAARPRVKVEGQIHHEAVPLDSLLLQALGTGGIDAALDSLLPSHPGYARLRRALAGLKDKARQGGWPGVRAEGPSIKRGDAGARVRELCLALAGRGYLESRRCGRRFDLTLENAVRAFQADHGLAPDGGADAATLHELNISVEKRIRQVELSLERWRWLPRDLGERHIFVNVPDYRLELRDKGKVVLAMKVVAGRDGSGTPFLSDTVTHIVLNPYWHVPAGIVRDELLPEIRENREFFRATDYEMVDPKAADEDSASPMDPATVDWDDLPEKGELPFHIRQKPGPRNALGRLKFLFPNRFNVYLHDTPAREHFGDRERAVSHGCVRVEKPVELAEALLAGQEGWEPDSLRRRLDSGKRRYVRVKRPVPVHLVYFTAWAEGDGRLRFRPDVYGWDAVLARRLEGGQVPSWPGPRAMK